MKSADPQPKSKAWLLFLLATVLFVIALLAGWIAPLFNSALALFRG